MLLYVPGQGFLQVRHLVQGKYGRIEAVLESEPVRIVRLGPGHMTEEEVDKVFDYVYMTMRANGHPGKPIKLDVESIIGRETSESDGS